MNTCLACVKHGYKEKTRVKGTWSFSSVVEYLFSRLPSNAQYKAEGKGCTEGQLVTWAWLSAQDLIEHRCSGDHC